MYQVIDCAWNVQAHAAQIRAAGVKTVIRYYNHQNSAALPSKRVTKAEAEALCDAGLTLCTVFQARGGANGHLSDLDAASGTADATRALELAGEIGQPPGSAIYFAVDHDYYKTADLAVITGYFAAAKAVLNGQYRIGVYGSGTIGKTLKAAGLVDLIWLAAASGWSGTQDMLMTADWALLQKYPALSWPGGAFTYDGNTVSAAWPDHGQFRVQMAWTGAGAGPAAPPIPDAPETVLMRVTARSGLNLRGGPGEQFPVSRTLPEGMIVHALGQSGGWFKVDLEGDGLADGFMSAQYLAPVSGGFPAVATGTQTPYEVAKAEIGVSEVSGAGDNPRIVMYHQTTNPWSGTADSVAWCSSFVNFCVEQAGLAGTDSQSAKSWKDWGEDVTANPMEGDIAVFDRPGGGHVAFFRKFVDQGHVSLLGGNQSNQVCVQTYPTNSGGYKLLTIRRP